MGPSERLENFQGKYEDLSYMFHRYEGYDAVAKSSPVENSIGHGP